MQTIVITLDSRKMENPDLDIRYALPDKLEKITSGRITDNGYDYITDTMLGIWLATENAEEIFSVVTDIVEKDSNLRFAEVYISDKENAELNECKKVYPTEILLILNKIKKLPAVRQFFCCCHSFSVMGSSIVASKTSPSIDTSNFPPQASVKLFAIDRPNPLPSVVRDSSPLVKRSVISSGVNFISYDDIFFIFIVTFSSALLSVR